MPAMTKAQRLVMKDFGEKFSELLEKYWNPIDSDDYWDNLTGDAMDLIAEFQSSDKVLNNFLSNMVASFLNSREEALH